MKTWDYASSGGGHKETGCCNLDSFNDARAAAVQQWLSAFYTWYKGKSLGFVIENFVEEYLAGRTPNPCVMCNTHIKMARPAERAKCTQLRFYRHRSCQYCAAYQWKIYNKQRIGWNQRSELCTLGPRLRNCWAVQLCLWVKYQKQRYDKWLLILAILNWRKEKRNYEICLYLITLSRLLKEGWKGLKKKLPADGLLIKRKQLGKRQNIHFYTIGQRKGWK